MPRPEGIDRKKVVIRKLPPYLKEEDLLAEVDKHAAGTYKWFLYAPGKASVKKVTFSRAYLCFHESKDVLDFKAKFDGFVFVGARGAQYKCSVEYAPYQRIPKTSSKKDPREGTIHKDSDFKTFVENLEKGPVMLPSAQRQFEEELSQKLTTGKEGEEEDGIITTPLMDFIVQKHLTKAATLKEKKEARQRDLRNARKAAKAKSLPPEKLRSRNTPKSERTDKTDSRGSGAGRGRRQIKSREKTETFAPKVLIKKKPSKPEEKGEDASESSKSGTASCGADGISRNRQKSSDRGSESNRGHSRRGRSDNRGTAGRPNVKVVWIPKAEKTKSE